MATFKEHSAYNTSAIVATAALLIISITFFSPAQSIGLATGVVSAVLSLAFVGIVGFFINLATPAHAVFEGYEILDDAASGITNKWASYFVLNFIVLLMVFIAINSAFAILSKENYIMVSGLVRLGLSYNSSATFSVGISSIIGTSVVYILCKRAGKLKDGFKPAAALFLITNAVCGLLFYLMNFVLFVTT